MTASPGGEGTHPSLHGRIDRARVDAMRPEEIEATAEADPDNPPATDEELAAGRLVFPADRAVP